MSTRTKELTPLRALARVLGVATRREGISATCAEGSQTQLLAGRKGEGARMAEREVCDVPNRQIAFLEIKTGAHARESANQAIRFPHIRSSGGTPRGANAAAAGLELGEAMPPTPTWTVYLPWPLP